MNSFEVSCVYIPVSYFNFTLALLIITWRAGITQYSDWLWVGQLKGQSLNPSKVKSFLSATLSRLTLWPTQPLIHWVWGIKWAGLEADHSPPTNAKVRKMWISTSTPHTASLYIPDLVKHGDNFTFYLLFIVCSSNISHPMLPETNLSLNMSIVILRLGLTAMLWLRRYAKARRS
jgi:hypothetical protein